MRWPKNHFRKKKLLLSWVFRRPYRIFNYYQTFLKITKPLQQKVVIKMKNSDKMCIWNSNNSTRLKGQSFLSLMGDKKGIFPHKFWKQAFHFIVLHKKRDKLCYKMYWKILPFQSIWSYWNSNMYFIWFFSLLLPYLIEKVKLYNTNISLFSNVSYFHRIS